MGIRELAEKIDAFQFKHDTDDYKDCITDEDERERNIEQNEKNLANKDKAVLKYLLQFTEDYNPVDAIVDAADLIQEVKFFWDERCRHKTKL